MSRKAQLKLIIILWKGGSPSQGPPSRNRLYTQFSQPQRTLYSTPLKHLLLKYLKITLSQLISSNLLHHTCHKSYKSLKNCDSGKTHNKIKQTKKLCAKTNSFLDNFPRNIVLYIRSTETNKMHKINLQPWRSGVALPNQRAEEALL